MAVPPAVGPSPFLTKTASSLASVFASVAATFASPSLTRMVRIRVTSFALTSIFDRSRESESEKPVSFLVAASTSSLVTSAAYVWESWPAAVSVSLSPLTGPTRRRVSASYLGGTPDVTT